MKDAAHWRERPEEFIVTIAFDAFYIAIGKKPRYHDLETIITFLRFRMGRLDEQP